MVERREHSRHTRRQGASYPKGLRPSPVEACNRTLHVPNRRTRRHQRLLRLPGYRCRPRVPPPPPKVVRATKFYVAADGRDASVGTVNQPLRTITEAIFRAWRGGLGGRLTLGLAIKADRPSRWGAGPWASVAIAARTIGKPRFRAFPIRACSYCDTDRIDLVDQTSYAGCINADRLDLTQSSPGSAGPSF